MHETNLPRSPWVPSGNSQNRTSNKEPLLTQREVCRIGLKHMQDVVQAQSLTGAKKKSGPASRHQTASPRFDVFEVPRRSGRSPALPYPPWYSHHSKKPAIFTTQN